VANVNIDDWIDKTVRVWFVPGGIGANRQPGTSGTLESADERGVLFSFQIEDAQHQLNQSYRFFPWHMIEFIEPMPS
jgi:hypothetical protein